MIAILPLEYMNIFKDKSSMLSGYHEPAPVGSDKQDDHQCAADTRELFPARGGHTTGMPFASVATSTVVTVTNHGRKVSPARFTTRRFPPPPPPHPHRAVPSIRVSSSSRACRRARQLFRQKLMMKGQRVIERNVAWA